MSDQGAPQKDRWWIAASVTFGTLMGAIDTSIMNVALPHLRGAFSATTEEISWVSTSYLLSAAIAMPLTGWLSAWFGRKRVYLFALQLFIVSSALCGLSPSLEMLVLARIVQGFGAGALQPIEQSILRQTFPLRDQGMAMGVYGIAIMFGPMLGPTLGGFILDEYSWPLAFYVSVPVGLLGLIMVQRFVHDPPDFVRKKTQIDFAGIGLLIAALAAVHILLERGERLDWFESKSNVAWAVFAAVAFAMFIAHELSIEKPVVNLRVLKNRSFASAAAIGMILGGVVFATLFILPIYMQDLLRWSATEAGLSLVPRALVMLVAFPIVGAVYNKVSPRVWIGFGLCAGAYSSYLMSKFTLDTSTAEILIPQVLQGLALACILTPLSTIALASVPREQMAEAAGLNGLARQLGGSFGVAIFASLLGRFATQNRASLAHAVTAGDSKVLVRTQGVIDYFWSRGADDVLAVERMLRRLDGRFTQQTMIIAVEHVFQWAGLLYLLSLPLLFLVKSPPRKGT